MEIIKQDERILYIPYYTPNKGRVIWWCRLVNTQSTYSRNIKIRNKSQECPPIIMKEGIDENY